MLNRKRVTCCFSGHRRIPTENLEEISRKLRMVLIKLIENGYIYFGAGGALGFDMLAKKMVLDLKRQYPQIKLILVLPCVSQANHWKEEDRRVYARIKEQADKVVYISQEYSKGCMHERNRHLVDNSSACVCYLTENTGGTMYTVQYAVRKGLYVQNVAKI